MPKVTVKGKYYNLPLLDVLDQPRVKYEKANVLKKGLRDAINTARLNDDNMEEVVAVLEHSLRHILQLKAKQKRVQAARKREETANA